jgi:flagellar biosynthesis/type III secretory pathway M-ring protein FliF/YscJ
MDKILCDKRFVMGASLVVALYVSFMDTLTVPDMVKDVVNSNVGKLAILALIAYLSDKCLTLALMLAVALCVMITTSNKENFMNHEEEHHGEEHHEEEHHEEEHHEEEHHEEEHHEEEHHEEEHHEEEHHEEEHHEEDKVSGIEAFQNYATF